MLLRDVNTTDIRDAIRLGCRAMGRVFNADDNDIPFFGSVVRPEARLSFSSCHSEAHVPGRHLNALLNAEATAGIAMDEAVIEKHARAAFFSYSGPAPLPLNREQLGGPLVNFCPHNVREGFHALYALAAFRGSQQALDLAERSIAAINDLWDAERGWDAARLAALGLADQGWGGPFITGLARCIGPLVKLHEATGSAAALDLARRLADKALAEFYVADGHYDGARFGTHVHSTTCVLSSLAQLARCLGDDAMMQRVAAFYDHGLWEIRDALGWSLENSQADANPDFGECNNTGDILETALILAQWGHPTAGDDAELILRAHLLPAQLRDTSFIIEPDNPQGEDGLRDLADRHLGAFGFPAPYGHAPVGMDWISFNMDIVGGAVGSLCAALRDGFVDNGDRISVHLLFDHEIPRLRVASPYTHDAFAVTVKAPDVQRLEVRLPAWADLAAVRIEGAREPVQWHGRLAQITSPTPGQPIVFHFPLPERDLVLSHRSRDIRVRLRGDEVLAMDDFGADLIYFPPLEETPA